MGSRDLDTVIERLRRSLDSDQPEKNSIIALTKTRAVLAARLFVLSKLLELYPNALMPRSWLLMQLLPDHMGLTPSDFWITISNSFAFSHESDLTNYIQNAVTKVLVRIRNQIPDQKTFVITIDEAQVAIDKHSNMFHSTTSPSQRHSFFTILLRTALCISGYDVCTILSETGLCIDDMKQDSDSLPVAKNIIQADRFVGITDGFYDITKMKEFVECFLGPLTKQQATCIFNYL